MKQAKCEDDCPTNCWDAEDEDYFYTQWRTDMKELITQLITEQENLTALEEEMNLLRRKIELAEGKVRSLKQQLCKELANEKSYLWQCDGKSYAVQRNEYSQINIVPLVNIE